MAARKDKLARAAHIKSSTKGSSNEVSLSVLDAAKIVMDERHGEARRIEQLGKISLYSGEREPDYQVMSLSDASSGRLTLKPLRRHKFGGSREKGLVSEKENDFGDVALPETASLSEREEAQLEGHAPSRAASGARPMFDGSSQSSFEYEVARKKATRKLRNGMKVAVVCAVVVALVACAAVGVRAYLAQKASFDESMAEVVSLVKGSEGEVVLVNDALSDPLSAFENGNFARAYDGLGAAREALLEAQTASASLSEAAMLTRDKEAAFQVSRTIEGRIAMIESATGLFSCLSSAESSIEKLSDVSDLVDKSRDYAQKASSRVDQSTSESLTEAQALLQQSIECLAEAAEKTAEVKVASPDADLSELSEYLSLQMEAYQAEVSAIAALSSGDTAGARSQQSVYESKAAQASKKASALSSIASPVISAYEKDASDLVENYTAARDEVATADEYLRGYLG